MTPMLFHTRVYYEDTDAGGVVYHANYLKFAERARTEWLRGLGTDHAKVRAEQGVLFAVKHLSVAYQVPARLDDQLEVQTVIRGCTGIMLAMRQILRDHEKAMIFATIDVQLVAVSPEGKARRIPSFLREKLRESL